MVAPSESVKGRHDLHRDNAWCKRSALGPDAKLRPCLRQLKELQACDHHTTTMNPFLSAADVETRLCTAVNAAIQSWNANSLSQIVQIEPPYHPSEEYQELIQSLRNNYPEDDDSSEQRLESPIKRIVPETGESEDAEGRPVQSWGSLVTFILNWMAFLRDVDPGNYLEVYQRLKELLE
jgi:hypothetical protein